MLNFHTAQLKRLPQRPDEVWQGGFVRLPGWIRGDPGPPFRPMLPLWVAVHADKVHCGRLCRQGEQDPGTALDAFVAFATDRKVGGYRPGRVEVRDAALAEHLRPLLADAGMTVVQRDQLTALDRMAADFVQTSLGGPGVPGALEGDGVTVERMRRFAEAASAFYDAAPWQHLTDEDLVAIESPRPPACFRCTTVLGAAGQTYGLGFYDGPEAIWEFRRVADFDAWFRGRTRAFWNLTFGPITELPVGDADLWEDHDFPVAGDNAYPCALGQSPKRGALRPDAQTLAYVEGVLRALAATTAAQIDTGRWTITLDTYDGPALFTLALPDLLEPPDHRELMRRGFAPDRRAMERMHAQMDRFLEEQPAENVDAVNEVLQREFVGREFDADRFPPRSRAEEAQDLCYQAFDARGRRRLQLARRALDVHPDCADAYVLLAERASDPSEALRLYGAGVEAGERTLGPARFERDVGHFWGMVDTRPYMRARQGLADTLERLGRREEAVEHYRELLRLNPGDNQGVRYLYLARLLELGRDAEAARFMKESEDEVTAAWAYTRALLAYRLGGDGPEAKRVLSEAVKSNPFVVDCLLAEEPPPVPESYRLGSPEEAAICAEELRPAFARTPGAFDWLAANGRVRPRLRPRQGAKKRRRKRR